MNESNIPNNSLVLYKNRPARVVKSAERLEIELDDRNQLKVRPKDVALLHPGPVQDLGRLLALAAGANSDVQLAWEIVADGQAPCTLAELAELAFGEYTPATAWAAWKWVEDGLYFQGDAENIHARPVAVIERDQEQRAARQAEAAARVDFLRRASLNEVSVEQDARFLREIEDLAIGRRKDSRLLRDLGRSERPENAHALLLEWGVWDDFVNPHPSRLGMPAASPKIELAALPDEPRLDLTGLAAYAIDDRSNQDPDDAITLVECRLDARGEFAGGKLWVHVADAAARVPPNSPADLEARARAATLYLPEGAVQLLPPEAVQTLGLGLQEVSPALSFLIKLDAAAQIEAVEVHPTWLRVQRLSYDQAETQIEAEPLAGLKRIGDAYHQRRQANGALLIDLPEVMIHVHDRQVTIEPVKRLNSRDLVREAMLMAGEAAAKLAMENHLPAPFVAQEPPAGRGTSGSGGDELSLAKRFAMRRGMRRSQVVSTPAPHAGVGLAAYCRVTSPLRRYLDLVAHQQLRAWLRGEALLGEQAMFERLGASDTILAATNTAEQLSRRHWTLVYLRQQPDWRGQGVLVEANGTRATLLVPELALEAPLMLREPLPPDSRLTVSVRDINLAELEVHFNVL